MKLLRPGLVLMLLLAGAAHADVIRCTDAAGRVSYTDQACPSGAKQTGSVAVPEAAGPDDGSGARAAQAQLDSVNRAREIQRETVESAGRSAAPAGAAIIDSRGGPAEVAPRDSERPDSGIVADTWYPEGAAHGHYRGPRPPRDMRPRMRQCDANGCTDNLGNHYNNKGQVDRYQGPNGKTCRQVNSMQICR